MIKEITDFNAPELDVYARLSENQLVNRADPDNGLFIAESPLVIERALIGGCEPVSFLREDGKNEALAEELISRCGDIPVYIAKKEILVNILGFKLTRGMLCCMKRPKRPSVEEICEKSRNIVVMEDVMNPTNVGAIFRSAAALNIDAVLLTHGASDPFYRRSARVSMGSVFLVPWAFIPECEDWQDLLKKFGYKTVAMALRDDALAMDDERLKQPEKLAIVMGTEGDGLKSSTIANCDFTVKIPMYHGVDSLNVAAASAVAFYQLAMLNRK